MLVSGKKNCTIKKESNQKRDTTFKKQILKMYNFALQAQDDFCTLKVLEMHLVLLCAFQLGHEALNMYLHSALFHVLTEIPEPKTRCISRVFKKHKLS